MSSKAGTIQSLLECPICLADFKDPRILPCLHTLCRECLESHVSALGQEGKFSCPSCRHECQIPEGGLSVVPQNFFLNSIRDWLQQHPKKMIGEEALYADSTHGHGDRECDNAKGSTSPHGKVTAFCVNCAEFYCKTCESSHGMFRAIRSHQMRPVNEVSAATVQAAKREARTRTCEKHPTQHTDFYCDTCQVPVCTKCCLLTHKQHDYRELVTVVQEFLDTLTDLDKTAAVQTDKLSKRLEELKTSQKDVKRDTNKAHQEVDQAAGDMINIVNKRRQFLHKQIEDIQKTALAGLVAACKETEINKASIESLQSYIQGLQMSGDITDYMAHTPGLQRQLQQHTAPPHAVTWTANFRRASNHVASLNVMLGSVGGELDLLQAMNHNLGDTVQEIAVIGNVVCVNKWLDPQLWLHHMKSGKEKLHTIDGLMATGMAALDSSTGLATLVIPDNNRKLHFVNINTETLEIEIHESKSLPFEPCHIKRNLTTGKLVIANNSDKEIVICDKTGSIESRLKVKADLKGMWCVLPDKNLHVLCDYSLEGRLLWVDNAGNVVHEHGKGKGEDLYNPEDMVSDSLGNLAVADKNNHGLYLFDAKKQLSCYLPTEADEIKDLTALYLDETTSQLFVACTDVQDQSVINVYKWPLLADSTTCTHHRLQVKMTRFE